MRYWSSIFIFIFLLVFSACKKDAAVSKTYIQLDSLNQQLENAGAVLATMDTMLIDSLIAIFDKHLMLLKSNSIDSVTMTFALALKDYRNEIERLKFFRKNYVSMKMAQIKQGDKLINLADDAKAGRISDQEFLNYFANETKQTQNLLNDLQTFSSGFRRAILQTVYVQNRFEQQTIK